MRKFDERNRTKNSLDFIFKLIKRVALIRMKGNKTYNFISCKMSNYLETARNEKNWSPRFHLGVMLLSQ